MADLRVNLFGKQLAGPVIAASVSYTHLDVYKRQRLLR